MRRSNLRVAAGLIGLVRPLAGYMALAIVMGVLGFLCAIFIPILGAWGLLGAAGQPSPLPLSTIFILAGIFAVSRGALRYGEQLCNHYIAFKLLAIIRERVFSALRRLAPAKLETREKGDLISVITSDIELLEVFYAHTISPVVIAVLIGIIMLIFIGSLHPVFALIALLGYFSVGVLIPLLTSRAGGEDAAQYRDSAGRLSGYMLESLRGLREVLQYGRGDERMLGIDRMTADMSARQSRLKHIEGISSGITGAAIMLFSLATLGVGIVLYSGGTISFDVMLIATVAVMSSFGPHVALSGLAGNLVHTFAAGNRVLDLLEERPETEEVTQGRTARHGELACASVGFAYGDTPILRDFNLSIAKGQTVGITGKSGSGKSTLLRLIMRFWDVGSGSVSIAGDDIRGINTESLRDLQSFVTQETQIFNDTVENNIKIANPAATHDQVVAACQKAALHDFITTLPDGYETRAGELGDSLSGGERQRVGLARAFLHDAPLILLDEPTSNLDSLNEGIILKSLSEQAEDKTVILVSHRMSTMAIADKVVAMDLTRKS